jgi:hypothetical protein
MVVFPELIVLWFVLSAPAQRIWIDVPVAAYASTEVCEAGGQTHESLHRNQVPAGVVVTHVCLAATTSPRSLLSRSYRE